MLVLVASLALVRVSSPNRTKRRDTPALECLASVPPSLFRSPWTFGFRLGRGQTKLTSPSACRYMKSARTLAPSARYAVHAIDLWVPIPSPPHAATQRLRVFALAHLNDDPAACEESLPHPRRVHTATSKYPHTLIQRLRYCSHAIETIDRGAPVPELKPRLRASTPMSAFHARPRKLTAYPALITQAKWWIMAVPRRL